MTKQKYGRIVNTSGRQGIPTISVYGAAKACVEAWTHALALVLDSLGIIISGVAPGLCHTGLTVNNNVDEFMYMVGQWIRLSTG